MYSVLCVLCVLCAVCYVCCVLCRLCVTNPCVSVIKSEYFGNLFGIIFRKVKVYAGHFTYHFLDFFGISML